MKKTKPSQQDNRTRQIHDIQHPVTAILSETVLAREWLKPEEDLAWNYL
jgi:hypothetical protein